VNLDRIALGTVQFGTNYGVANASGQVSIPEVQKILNFAKKNRIKTLDTASSYGESETVLGNYGLSNWEVVTKIPSIPENISNIQEWIVSQVESSLRRLNTEKVDGILLHDSDQILGKNRNIIRQSLSYLKESKLCKKVGLSIYDVNKINEYIKDGDIDLIQAPLNIFDKRLIKSDILEALKNRGIEIHARSIFLQGLLLLKRDSLPITFADSQSLFDEWHFWLRQNNLDAVEACLKFVTQYKDIDKIVLGVQDIQQLEKIVSIISNNTHVEFPEWQSKINDKLINPSLW
jgi:aryl-alcohol dehydrogenase-like predicted oxidoreductase